MTISIDGTCPPATELVLILNDAFGSCYSFRLFGPGKEKTIMASKSAPVRLQMSFTDEQLNFQRAAPTIAGSVFSFMMLTELSVLLILPLIILSHGFRRYPYKEIKSDLSKLKW